MNFLYDMHDETIRWNRKLLNIHWFYVIALTLAELANIPFTVYSFRYYAVHHILLPTVLFLAVMAVSEWAYRRISQVSPDIIILSGVLLTTAAVYVHALVVVALSLYCYPLLLAMFYFKKQVVWRTSAYTMAGIMLVYGISDNLQTTLRVSDMLSTLLIVGIATPYVATKLMDRGTDILLSTRRDSLTGLYNHKTFHDSLRMATERRMQADLALAIFDIDDFKQVNDTFGHRAGDAVLRRVAETLSRHVGPNELAARYGGEEFVVLFPNRGLKSALKICETIRQAVENTSHPELQNQAVTVSIGVSVFDKKFDKESWFNHTDRLLYQAKKEGKNRIVS